MSDSPVRHEQADGVATITLNRPEALNSLTHDTKEALRDAVEYVASDVAVRCVVITGTGRAFSVGQDLGEHVDNLATKSMAEIWATVPEHFTPIASAIATMPKPVIAAVNGVAAGAGAAIALACDLRLFADTAGLNTAFTSIGLSCDTGTAWTLPRLIGYAKAVELLLLPRTVNATEAAGLGLATRVVPAPELAAAVGELARTLAAGPTMAYAAVKRVVAYGATHDLAATLAVEGKQMALTGASQDHRDAVAAFLAKQPPVFHGR
ncbi:MAG: enoyl-CoA hydratase/isomerase family protein [Nocardioidaceae bacterium]|nr:enoyl-CoA hydratase/isomerase family protein [Nocardioidaceae bacterium]